jgi:hypothetical protein
MHRCWWDETVPDKAFGSVIVRVFRRIEPVANNDRIN